MLGSRLKYKIEIYEKQKVKSSIGSTTSTDVLIASVKSDIHIDIGRSVNNEDITFNQTEAVFIIRNYPTMSYDYTIVYNSDTYRILAIQPLLDGSGQKIKAIRNS